MLNLDLRLFFKKKMSFLPKCPASDVCVCADAAPSIVQCKWMFSSFRPQVRMGRPDAGVRARPQPGGQAPDPQPPRHTARVWSRGKSPLSTWTREPPWTAINGPKIPLLVAKWHTLYKLNKIYKLCSDGKRAVCVLFN